MGRELRQRRKEMGLSQEVVGRLMGKAQPQIAALEAGKVDPRLGGVVQLARTLGLELMLVPVQRVPAVRLLLGQRLKEDRDRLVGVRHEGEEDLDG